MKSNSIRLFIGLFACLTFVATGCSSISPVLAPLTPSPIPATATLIPAEPTAVPPTSTPLPTAPPSGAITSATGIFGAALEKAKSATAYRLELQVTGNGNLGLTGDVTPAANVTPVAPANEEITMISMKGEVTGQESHLSLQGLFAAFLGVDPSKSLEVVTVGGKSYVHGPAAFIGANEDKWYELPTGESSVAEPPLTPNSLLESISATGLDPNDFKKTNTESLDNHSCDVYTGDQATIEKTFKSVGQAAGAGDWSSIDSADFKLWICDDGFLHQFRMAITAHSQDQPDQKGSFLVQMHIYDFGANIKIEAPTDAEPLKVPSILNLGTPTP